MTLIIIIIIIKIYTFDFNAVDRRLSLKSRGQHIEIYNVYMNGIFFFGIFILSQSRILIKSVVEIAFMTPFI